MISESPVPIRFIQNDTNSCFIRSFERAIEHCQGDIIARQYNVSADWLLGLSDDPAPPDRTIMPPYGPELLAILHELPNHFQAMLGAQAEAALDV